MSAKDRAALIQKLHKVCKKHYDVISPPSDRQVLEHMLYSCCLENSSIEAADEAFARLQQEYFDWNEVRVTTATELAVVCKSLTDPKAGAISVKKTLQGIFSTYYQFDIDFLKKENLSKAVAQFGRFRGVSGYIVSYTAQNGLGGHSIPIDEALLLLMKTIGVITEAEAEKRKVTGLERTIPKSQGAEFSILVHQLAVAFYKSPFNKQVREILLSIAPDSKDRFPKRGEAIRLDEKLALKAQKAEEERLAAKQAAIEAEKEAERLIKEAERQKILDAKRKEAEKLKKIKDKERAKIEAAKEKERAKIRAAKEKEKAKQKAAKEKEAKKKAIVKEKEAKKKAAAKKKADAAKKKAAIAKKKAADKKKKVAKKKTTKKKPAKTRIVRKKKKKKPIKSSSKRIGRKKPR